MSFKEYQTQENVAKIYIPFFFALTPLFPSMLISNAWINACCMEGTQYTFLKNKWVNEQMNKWESLIPGKMLVQWAKYWAEYKYLPTVIFLFSSCPTGIGAHIWAV